jgi:hypothetical protein
MYIRYLDYKDAKAAEAAEEKTSDLSEEFRAAVTKVADGKVTFTRTMTTKDGRKVDDEQTLPVADNVKVVRGKLDKDTREVEAGEPIERGLKNELFTRAGDKGLRVILVTDAANKKVAEVYVFGPGKRGP